MIAPADMAHCHAAIRTGSLSFHAASRLLPARVRDPALALYAFCRLADDAVDEGGAKTDAVLTLRDRLDLAYAGRPRNAAADRAFATIVTEYDMPRALPEALLEGLAWDAMGRRYDTLSDVLDYSARVASAVGAMMCVLMRVREADALARACDLGAAMQLTNIARDVGEDARAGRLYLPRDWLRSAGIEPNHLLFAPAFTPALGTVVHRLLAEADRLYRRAEAGIAALPRDCRPGIFAAARIYAGIGGRIRQASGNSVDWRARTTGGQKAAWLGQALAETGVTMVMPRSAVLHAAPLPETAFLVDAAARPARRDGWSDGVLAILAELESRDRTRRGVEQVSA